MHKYIPLDPNRKFSFRFHKMLNNPTAPSGRVGMYEILDEKMQTFCTVGIDEKDCVGDERINLIVNTLNQAADTGSLFRELMERKNVK